MLLRRMKRQRLVTMRSDSSFKGQRSLLENVMLEKPFPQNQAGGAFPFIELNRSTMA